MERPNPLDVRELVLNTRTPIILRNVGHTWTGFPGSLDEWCRQYDAAAKGPVEFERMPKQNGRRPQFERRRQAVRLTAVQFLAEHRATERDYWTGLNYKRAEEVPAQCRQGVDFGFCGFPHAAADCSYWLSSAGANTPCHYDSHGCNVVVQVYGRKSWLLFPPEAPLHSTRIPYEESSVYCTENFYSPDPRKMQDLEHLQQYAYRCVLEPDSVLVVPRHWWHYVETVATSLSVNYWIPLQADIDTQMEEGIVKYVMESVVTAGRDPTIADYVLNPNQRHEIAGNAQLFDVLQHLASSAQSVAVARAAKESERIFPYQYLSTAEVDALVREQFPNACAVPHLTATQFQEILLENTKRFRGAEAETGAAGPAPDDVDDEAPLCKIEEILINSICCPRVIASIREEFCKRIAATGNEQDT